MPFGFFFSIRAQPGSISTRSNTAKPAHRPLVSVFSNYLGSALAPITGAVLALAGWPSVIAGQSVVVLGRQIWAELRTSAQKDCGLKDRFYARNLRTLQLDLGERFL